VSCLEFATIEKDGWTLLSGEARQARNPATFEIPSRASRESLCVGDAAKLLFDIETRQSGRVIDRGVDRMWVIVRKRIGGLYVGLLDNDPGFSENLTLHSGSEVLFGPEHVVAIERPGKDYVTRRFGSDFFDG
jgi:hypothetical protein